MTTYTCPKGHDSTAGDYCDVCGSPIGGSSTPASAGSQAPAVPPVPPSDVAASSLDLDAPAPDVPAPAAPAGQVCPSCSVTGLPGALFCENCGYDFTTGQMPRSAGARRTPAPGRAHPAPSSSHRPATRRRRVRRPPAQHRRTVEWVVEIWVDPDWHAAQDVDEACPSPGLPVVVPLRDRSVLIGRTSASRNIHPEVEVVGDTGVSRRHAQLTNDGRRWWVEDLQSANGTYIGVSGSPLPVQPINPGQRAELPEDGRIYLGAWTRLVIRKALPSEV